jgi:hypothetical protein
VLGTYLGKTAPQNPPIPLKLLFPEDSVSTEPDEDLAEELGEFFRFRIWNDLSGEEEEEEESSFIEDEEREGSISATDLFAEIHDYDDIITDDSDDEGYLPQVSDDRVRFPLRSRSEVRFFLASPTKNFPKTFIIEIFVEVKTWLNQSLVVVVVCHWPCRESHSYRRREELSCNSTSSSSLSFAIVARRVFVRC